MSRDTADFIIRSAAAWFFRSRNVETWIFRGSVGVLIVLHGANWIVKYTGSAGQPATIEIGVAGATPEIILWGLTGVCVLLMLGSAAWAWTRYKAEQERLSRKRVFVIEGRGLRDDDGSPLLSAISGDVLGIRLDYLMDLRQRKDGKIVEADDLLPRVDAMKTWLHQAQKSSDRSDLTTIYGGLTSVPLTFLTGLLLDDEGEIVVMDWDRTASKWRPLDGADDSLRLAVSGVEEVHDARDVVLAVSFSYLVKPEDLASTFTYPVVRMTLSDFQSSHWSQAKQSAIAEQFLGVLKQLDAMGVDRIHLVLAAQNSVVFNLARRYDKRNLPKVTVYQFERAQEQRYPWGVEMPVAGVAAARVVYAGNVDIEPRSGS